MLHGFRQLYSLHKNEGIYTDFAADVETRFDTSDCEFKRSLPRGDIIAY